LRVGLHGVFEGHQPGTFAEIRPQGVDEVGVFGLGASL
jgi:hypothetical protein